MHQGPIAVIPPPQTVCVYCTLIRISYRDVNGDAPLHLAAARGDTEMVRLLLSGGADQNPTDTNRRTPLHIAARCVVDGFSNTPVFATYAPGGVFGYGMLPGRCGQGSEVLFNLPFRELALGNAHYSSSHTATRDLPFTRFHMRTHVRAILDADEGMDTRRQPTHCCRVGPG